MAPAWAASGLSVATIPSQEATTDRPCERPSWADCWWEMVTMVLPVQDGDGRVIGTPDGHHRSGVIHNIHIDDTHCFAVATHPCNNRERRVDGRTQIVHSEINRGQRLSGEHGQGIIADRVDDRGNGAAV